MKTLRNYVAGDWHESSTGFRELVDPSTEETVARASSDGVDFGSVLEHARLHGGPGLRALTYGERGEMLLSLSKALHGHRDELIALSVETSGTTRKDAKFDLDGAMGTLSYYGYLGKELGDRRVLLDGDGTALGRSAKFWGQHVRLPRLGVAVHINAFNFPAWGLAEKAACAWLAGMPVVSKPATSTALVAHRCAEILVESGLLPAGAFAFIAGSTGDLVGRLGAQDVLAFTGSADTALKLRRSENLLASSAHVNIEADSLNAAVFGPDVEPGTELWDLFVNDVTREITQKTGQKCTAVRRIFVPEDRVDDVLEVLIDRLSQVVVGHPARDGVGMGPLATADQLRDAVEGTARLTDGAEIVFGAGERVDGEGAESGKGFYFGPTLLRARDAESAGIVHTHEVFGPVATIIPYDGGAVAAASGVSRGEGTLVVSTYSDDEKWTGEFIAHGAAWTGRLYLGSTKMAGQAMGSGVALPQSLHGGPGRAGGGEELGGLRGLELYSQRVALQGSRPMIEHLYGE